MKKFFLFLFIIVLTSFSTLCLYNYLFPNRQLVVNSQPAVQYANLPVFSSSNQPVDFTYAAEVVTPVVVHVQTKYFPKYNNRYIDPFRYFFGEDFFGGAPQQHHGQAKVSFGSGVIISADGYIVTNNHVIENGDEIEVTLNDKRSFSATVIGTDHSTDLAVIKIDATSLPYINFSNSDEVKVGEWVLAVGNPFNLSSTVTAGIVSAKGRNLNILKDQAAIESFIQTDAAVNPGNSGGALVDLSGSLIGINTAIATPTGSYAGYAFAVPSNLVKKVMEDIIEYGIVQRGILGVTIKDIDKDLADKIGIQSLEGAYINSIVNGSSAEEAGLKEGDIIIEINGVKILGATSLQEQVAHYRPGDQLSIKAIRNKQSKSFSAQLKNIAGNTNVIQKETVDNLSALGVEFKELSSKELKALGIDGGVQITGLKDGILKKSTTVKQGFIITKIDNQKIKSVQDIANVLSKKKGGILLEGRYPEYSGVYYYAFGI